MVRSCQTDSSVDEAEGAPGGLLLRLPILAGRDLAVVTAGGSRQMTARQEPQPVAVPNGALPVARRRRDCEHQERLEEMVDWRDSHTCHDCRRHEGCPQLHAAHRELTQLLGRQGVVVLPPGAGLGM